MALKIISGIWRGHHLLEPPHKGDVRPTKHAARAAIFNMLEARINFTEVRVADFFAGSGSLGFEAASRGAEHVCLIDQNPTYLRRNMARLAAVQKGEETTKALAKCQILLGDFKTVKLPQAASVVLADPPYHQNLCEKLISRAKTVGQTGALWVLETEAEADLTPILEAHQFTLIKHKKFGASALWLAEQRA